MDASSRYWKICRISPKSETVGYEYYFVPTAQEFLKKNFLKLQEKEELSNLSSLPNGGIQAVLLSFFHSTNASVDITNLARAGFCLRCDVSYPILKACQKIDILFGEDKSFTYRDLLPFVLNDDGQTPVILDKDGKTQLILDEQGKTKITAYKFFTVEVLRTFKPNSPKSMNLENWAYLQTKQNQELKDFLSEFGFKHRSDWGLLNRVRTKQFERLSQRDQFLVEVFHLVYRRDRIRQQHRGIGQCPDPTKAQLEEMLICLQKRDVVINTTAELMTELKQVVKQLRHYDIWSYREPLEIYDPETGSDVPRPDLPYESLNEVDVEQQEILEFFHQQLRLALDQAIKQEIYACITKLEKSKKYAPFAQQFTSGLQLYYCQALSLKDIAPKLGMTSWDQARRVLNPGELLSNVRELTMQQVLDKTLEKAKDKGLTEVIPEPDYLKALVEQIEAFADEEIFTEAAEEIRAGKNRSMNSLYAQQLRLYLEKPS